MFILKRFVSEYSGPDLLLGLFTTESKAESARSAYVAERTSNPADDPWAEQAYRTPGSLKSEELAVEYVAAGGLSGSGAFVVSRYSEAFGQVSREIDSVHGSLAQATERVEMLNADEDDFPRYALVQHVQLDVLLSDRREDQPELP